MPILQSRVGQRSNLMSALGQKRTCAPQQVMSAFVLKATEIADIVGRNEGQSISCSAFKRQPARQWRGHRPHRCRDTEQCSLSWCDLGRREGSPIPSLTNFVSLPKRTFNYS